MDKEEDEGLIDASDLVGVGAGNVGVGGGKRKKMKTPSKKSKSDPATTSIKKFKPRDEEWAKRFFCGKRLIFGPDVSSLFLTSFLIGAPAFTFCIRMLVWIRKGDPFFNYTVLTSAFILTLLVCLLL
ncbi:unnamed protein product [Microthlaspi erraticum]|uniref:Uncharacterized protein n=1 Tax=Microthlaspi erraticum TaxID=1685480 RepID=A0A6D2IXD3_9BRAS|nr:unnamed protein product [Microthlaspi erraticum]